MNPNIDLQNRTSGGKFSSGGLAPLPERFCGWCMKPMKLRKGEKRSQFLRRACCDRVCSAKLGGVNSSGEVWHQFKIPATEISCANCRYMREPEFGRHCSSCHNGESFQSALKG